MLRSLFSKHGSITVFLTLIFLVILSFVFTTLEAARISANGAYLEMISNMAAESLLGDYYYPLFNDYGLLAVDSGYGTKEADEALLKDKIAEYLIYAYDNTAGGMIGGNNAGIRELSFMTIQEDGSGGIRNQVREEALYEGAEICLNDLLGLEDLSQTKVLPAIYAKQAEAMEKSANVTRELLRLMMLVDGVSMTETGFNVNENNELCSERGFLKSYGICDAQYMQSTYKSTRVYDAVKAEIFFPKDVCERVFFTMEHYRELAEKRKTLNKKIREELQQLNDYKEAAETMDGIKDHDTAEADDHGDENGDIYAEIEKIERSIGIHEEEITSLDDEIYLLRGAAEESYRLVQSMTEDNIRITKEILLLLQDILIREKAAKAVIDEYASFVSECDSVKGGLLDAFVNDAVQIREYADLEKNGYDIPDMMAELTRNLLVLRRVSFPEFDIDEPGEALDAIEELSRTFDRLSYDSLVFDYGGITAGRGTGSNIGSFLRDTAGTAFLKYIGVDDVSNKTLNGLDLVSETEADEFRFDPFGAFEKMSDMFSGTDIYGFIRESTEKMSDDILMEAYLYSHFSDHSAKKRNTRLEYEREYILCGHHDDRSNLCEMALKLIALRTIFTFASIMADPTRNSEATALAATVSGMTGVPWLSYVVKYTIITTWAVEEAMVEVCALFSGKRVPIYRGVGRIGIQELPLMTGSNIRAKAETIPKESVGPDYVEYLTILSLLTNLRDKELRMLDLIQENIRLEYRDSFRIHNCLTEVSFESQVYMKRIFDTGFFTDDVYMLTGKTTVSY